MSFITYLAKQALNEKIDDVLGSNKKGADIKEKVTQAPAKGDNSQLGNRGAFKKGVFSRTGEDFALYDVALPSIAAIARLLGMSVGTFIASIAATQTAKALQTPGGKKEKYGKTFHDSAAASAAPVTAAVGKIAGMTGNEVANVIDNAAMQKKLDRDMEILANREAFGLPNSNGFYTYLNGAQSRAYDRLKANKSALTTVEKPSDENLKDIDFEKCVDLCRKAGKCGDKDIFNDDEEYDDSVLDAYAEHIKNYAYNYKDEAKEIDPTISTEQTHIGPMAQDIEQVNPACVTEKDGYKIVDTGRLALMNAGAIGDLAREITQIKEQLDV